MRQDEIRDKRFYNIKEEIKVSEERLNFEALFQVKSTYYDKNDRS